MPYHSFIGLGAKKLCGTCDLRDLVCAVFLPFVIVFQVLRRHNIGCVLARQRFDVLFPGFGALGDRPLMLLTFQLRPR